MILSIKSREKTAPCREILGRATWAVSSRASMAVAHLDATLQQPESHCCWTHVQLLSNAYEREPLGIQALDLVNVGLSQTTPAGDNTFALQDDADGTAIDLEA